jgi:glycerophosphoryl diester phosphodiesterase
MEKTLALAHRGFSGRYPENTLAAFMAAIEIPGCDGFESDVHLSADNEPVIIHDPVLERTTNGTGPVREHTFEELRKLDCGSWMDSRFAGQRIMHLDELLDLCIEHDKVLNLEIKNYDVFYQNIEEIVIRHILDKKAENRVFLSSFNNASMVLCKDIASQIETGFLYSYPMFNAADYAKRSGVNALHPRYTCMQYDPNLVKQAHEAGLKINTWTANTDEDIRMCLDLGVDSIISNYPDRLVELIREQKGEDS